MAALQLILLEFRRMGWLLNNYKWLFDGVGGLLLLALLPLAVRRLRRLALPSGLAMRPSDGRLPAISMGTHRVAGVRGMGRADEPAPLSRNSFRGFTFPQRRLSPRATRGKSRCAPV